MIAILDPIHKNNDGNPLRPIVDRRAWTLHPNTYELEYTVKSRGGPYSANIIVSPGKNNLRAIFDSYLGYRVKRLDGGSWTGGMIRQMTYVHGGITEQITLDFVANKVKAIYTDDDGELKETAWYEDVQSQARWGVIERVIDMGSESSVVASRAALVYVNENSQPYVELLNLKAGEIDADYLEIEAVGYSYLLTHRYPDIAAIIAGTAGSISEIVAALINDQPYLKIGRTETTTITVDKAKPHLSTLDYINSLCDLGGDTAAPMTFRIDANGRFTYYEVRSEPIMRFINGRLRPMGSAQDLTGDQVRPGVASIAGVRPGVQRPNSWLRRYYLTFVDQVTRTQNNEVRLGAPMRGSSGRNIAEFGASAQTSNLKSTADGDSNPGQLLKTSTNGDVGVRKIALNGASLIDGTDDSIALSDQAAMLATETRNMIVLNAYNDGSWRYRADGRAFMIRLDSASGIQMFAAVSGTAGALLSWSLLETWS